MHAIHFSQAGRCLLSAFECNVAEPDAVPAFAGAQLLGTSKLGVHIPKAGVCPFARVAILGEKR